MGFPNNWSTCSPYTGGGAATKWSHVYDYADEFVWTCYHFASTPRTPILMNLAIAIHLIIEKCDSLQSQIDAGAAIDMSAILAAMANAKPHQPLLFMGYLEAYKASVWNATFDELFFADLVKKWSLWE